MSDIWPPADFTYWPATRIGALVINAVILALMLIPKTRKLIFQTTWSCCCNAADNWLVYTMLIVKAIVLGFIVGMFVHFIPCLWWTCDWGPNDGQGVRGGIWFISGAIIGVIVLCMGCMQVRNGPLKQENDEEQGDAASKGEEMEEQPAADGSFAAVTE